MNEDSEIIGYGVRLVISVDRHGNQTSHTERYPLHRSEKATPLRFPITVISDSALNPDSVLDDVLDAEEIG